MKYNKPFSFILLRKPKLASIKRAENNVTKCVCVCGLCAVYAKLIGTSNFKTMHTLTKNIFWWCACTNWNIPHTPRRKCHKQCKRIVFSSLRTRNNNKKKKTLYKYSDGVGGGDGGSFICSRTWYDPLLFFSVSGITFLLPHFKVGGGAAAHKFLLT